MDVFREETKEYIVETDSVDRVYTIGKVQIPALTNLNIKLERKKFISFVGPSGCGKTTTLNILGLIDQPTRGKIIINGQDVSKFNDTQITLFRGRTIGFIFQNFNLIPVLTAQENVAYPLQLLSVPRKEIRQRSEEMLEAVGLSDWAYHRPNELSGGQRQRVAIARALVINPKLVIADEPTANLDTKTTFRIMDLMKEMQIQLRTTFLFATHDPRFFDYMDIIHEMSDGVIKDTQYLKKGL